MKKSLSALSLGLSVLNFTSVACAENDYDLGKNGGLGNLGGLDNWTFKLGTNYQQFSNNGSTYAQNSNNQSFNIDPGYHFGFDAGVGYHVPGKDSDIEFDYTHLSTSDSSSESGPGLSLTTDVVTGPFTWVQGKNEFEYDSYDLTAGHKIKLTPSFGLDYYGGLNYTHLSKDMTLQGTNVGTTYQNDLGTTFDGFGPTFGMDGECEPFDYYPGFSVFGGLQGSALYGTMSGYSHSNDNGTVTADNIPNQKLVVPAIGANLGLNYKIPMRGGYNLDTRLGYESTEYFGATKDSNYNNTNSNASMQGGFFNIRMTF